MAAGVDLGTRCCAAGPCGRRRRVRRRCGAAPGPVPGVAEHSVVTGPRIPSLEVTPLISCSPSATGEFWWEPLRHVVGSEAAAASPEVWPSMIGSPSAPRMSLARRQEGARRAFCLLNSLVELVNIDRRLDRVDLGVSYLG